MKDDYPAHGLFKNGHFNTLYSHFFGRVEVLPFQREPLPHPLGFNLHLDWVKNGNDKLVIFSHGLESNSHARYIQTMGKRLLDNGFDVAAWNLRNCAVGEPWQENAHYHSGISEDLAMVIEHIRRSNEYDRIVLIGFSMGGNITLKYLGEMANNLPKEISHAIAISTPLDLLSCSYVLLKFPNIFYGRHFLSTILDKVHGQRKSIEAIGLDVDKLLQAKNLREFDDWFTAPTHGFHSQDHYYISCSSLPLLKHIGIPTLLINAHDDPILSPECFPTREEINNDLITTLYTRHGGHVGFYTSGSPQDSWLDSKISRFLASPDYS